MWGVVDMPKRRMTAARKAQIKLWQSRSWSSPEAKARRQIRAYYAGKLGGYTPPGLDGRRAKYGGKAYQRKTAGNFKINPQLQKLLASSKVR